MAPKLSGSGAARTYTPDLHYHGPDSVTFKANDGTVDSNVATVSITVTQNDPATVGDYRAAFNFKLQKDYDAEELRAKYCPERATPMDYVRIVACDRV